MASKPKPRTKPKGVAARARADRAFLKKALANPGLRAKLDASQLPTALRQQREMNARLNAPIVAGSATTERDLANAAQAAVGVRYGPQERQIGENLGISQQTERDTGSFYDQYRQNLLQHAQNIQAYQAGAQQALAQTAQGITGLAGQGAADLQTQANAGAAQQGVAQAGNLGPMASDATAVRQGIMGSFQGMQALQGAASNTYADAQANVVAPGQKLAAQAQAAGKTRDIRKQLTDLKTEEGAFNQQFRDTRRQDEFKNVLAQQTLTGNQAIAATNAATSASKAAAASDPATAAAKTSATASATQAARYGYTAHQWAMLGPTARAKIIKDAKTSSSGGGGSDTVYTSGPFAGRKKSEIAALSDAQRRKIVKDYNAGKTKAPKPGDQATQDAKDFYAKYGVKPASTVQINNATSSIQQAQTWLNRLGGANSVNGQILSNGQAAGKNKDGSKRPAVPKIPALFVRAAMDIKQYGGIRPGTADRLHHAGYSVAKLRLKSAPRARPSAGAAIPGVGATGGR